VDGWRAACLTRRAGLALCAWLALALPLAVPDVAHAHHSFAMYDSSNQLQLSGTVTSFIWSNPHVYIGLAVLEERGTVNTYILECASPAILQRMGWRSNILKPGDRVTVIIAPLASGDPGGLLKQLIMPDGRRLSDGALVGSPSVQ
jgi:hypothetical protein